jgi:EAL domain-containing protein (putative c-di-GMP-specific phosphodiesterase class I)
VRSPARWWGSATRSGATLVAEGIESPDELATLRALGVHYGQGFGLGRPGRPQDVVRRPPLVVDLIAGERDGVEHR